MNTLVANKNSMYGTPSIHESSVLSHIGGGVNTQTIYNSNQR